jgi:hypothetical protein
MRITRQPILLVSLLTVLLLPLAPAVAASAVVKCTVNGSVVYQDGPCPGAAPRAAPSVEQLNAERRKKLREAAGNPSNRAASAPKGQPTAGPAAASAPQAGGDRVRADPPAMPAAPAPPAYRCDGRTRCTQMTSCAEATFFLRNCPGVKMDGDGDGIPCEDQWCH